MSRILLVVTIDKRSGNWTNGWFKVASLHRSWVKACRTAIWYRQRGYLARVRPTRGKMWMVAVRKPRKRSPYRNHVVL